MQLPRHCLASLFFAALAYSAPSATKTKACTESAFGGALPQEASIVSVDAVPAGGQYGEGSRNPAYPKIPTNLPELCAVVVNVTSSPISSYRFGVLLPTADAWNKGFLAVGNGGFSGGINWIDAAVGPRYGFVGVSTDTGHNSTSGDVTWATNDETKQDWGHRAIHGAATLGKKMAEAYYGAPVDHSYYSGCSTGGRQGLKEAQLHPETFDALLIGAPAWWTSHLQTWTLRVGALNQPADAPHHIPVQKFSLIAQETLEQCDGADGVNDGIISQPEKCNLDLNTLLCTSGTVNSTCLTNAQIETANKVHADYIAEGRFAFPGLSISAETLWAFLLGASEPSSYGTQYVQYMLLNDPTWRWQDYTDEIVWRADRENPGNASATAYNMSAFRDKGGKIIMYHGIADGLIPTGSSHYFYQQVANATGGISPLRDWFRYYDVPGMGHCSGSSYNAPSYFAGANQAENLGTSGYSVPGFSDAKHDVLLALTQWAEKGETPESIIATAWKSVNNPASGVLKQRPLCPFPEVAKYDGKGYLNAAESWTCQ
ncbi:feruloyl esterase B [Pyricularia oryzae]|uniref:Carboxylic ester hydrolase n=2 Tax=Pyricularia oryzae TaxID=318829 RepID=A0AA97P1S3_PYRO3|nr:feruloyl esterase B [Pyricularia oryzae Y34]KAI7927889.1 feruloyl esterase B [Pyricularia oryzae]